MGRPFLHYLLFALIAAALALGAAGALTWSVDPYAVHGRERVTRFNDRKPFAYTHARLAKQRLASAARPRTLFLGNSRIDGGLDPQSASLPEAARPAFNYAIPGQGLSGDYANLVGTAGLDRVTRLIVGVDFLDFPSRDARLQSPTPATPAPAASGQAAARQFMQTTLSIDALVHSALTIRAQRDPYANSMTAGGLNTFDAHRGFARLEGYWSVFHQRNVDNARKYVKLPRLLGDGGSRIAPTYNYLDWIIDWSRAHGVAVVLVIPPYHAHILEMFHHGGLWPLFETWKRQLAARVARARTVKGENGFDVTLYDFSGYHRYAMEPVPARGDTRGQTRWYWEAGHFKTALGERVLARLFDTAEAQTRDFGIVLTPGSVENAIAQAASGRDRWREQRPEESDYIATLYRKAAAR